MEAAEIYSCVSPWWCSAHLVWLIFMRLRGTVNFLWGLTLKVRQTERNRFTTQRTVALVAAAITVPCSYGGSDPTWWLKCPSLQSCDLIIVALRDYLDSPKTNDALRIRRANINHVFAIVIFADSSSGLKSWMKSLRCTENILLFIHPSSVTVAGWEPWTSHHHTHSSLTPTQLETLVDWMFIFLDCGRKLEHLETRHRDTGKTRRCHTKHTDSRSTRWLAASLPLCPRKTLQRQQKKNSLFERLKICTVPYNFNRLI